MLYLTLFMIPAKLSFFLRADGNFQSLFFFLLCWLKQKRSALPSPRKHWLTKRILLSYATIFPELRVVSSTLTYPQLRTSVRAHFQQDLQRGAVEF